MECISQFGKGIFSSLLSIFDITSDAVNSFDLLGYQASESVLEVAYEVVKNTFGNNTPSFLSPTIQDTPKNLTKRCRRILNLTSLINSSLSAHLKGNDNYDIGSASNITISNESQILCSVDKIEDTVHVVWGITGMLIMFLPGIVATIILLSRSDNKIFMQRKGYQKLFIIISVLMFPLCLVLLQLFSTLTCGGVTFRGYIAIGVGLEAFL